MPKDKDKDKDDKSPPSAEPPGRAECRTRDPGAPPVTGNVYIDNDRIIAAGDSHPGREAHSYEAAVKGVAADFVACLLVPGQLHKLPKVMGRIGSAVTLACDINVSRAAVKLPANSANVQASGEELVEVAETDPEADFLEVEVDKTQPKLDRGGFLRELHSEVVWLPEAIHNNWTHLIDEVNGDIEEALKDKRVEKVQANVRLAAKLPLTLELVTGSRKKAAETLKEHQRVAREAVAKERAKQGTPPAAPPAPPVPDPTKKP